MLHSVLVLNRDNKILFERFFVADAVATQLVWKQTVYRQLGERLATLPPCTSLFRVTDEHGEKTTVFRVNGELCVCVTGLSGGGPMGTDEVILHEAMESVTAMLLNTCRTVTLTEAKLLSDHAKVQRFLDHMASEGVIGLTDQAELRLAVKMMM